MTLGEKIKYARKCYGLSQEQLANKLCVSRSAIAMWETDKGIPDVENLKILSKILCISVDTLLADGEPCQSAVVRYPINLSAYGRGCKKVKIERLLKGKFPESKICCLLGRPILSQDETTVDTSRGILTPAPFGTAEFMTSIRDQEQVFYLVEQEDPRFITATENWIEIRPLSQVPEDKSFHIGGWCFIRLHYLEAE